MPRRFRAFVGVDLPVPGRVQALVASLGGLGKAVRTVPAGNLHVTLKFLGDVEADEIREIDTITKAACEGIDPFDVRLVGLGAFPKIERPSVVWVGIENGEPLVEMANRLETALAPLGYPPEARAFTPHLTVARVKFRPPPELDELFTRHATTPFGTSPISRVVLYESSRHPTGPEYTPLATYDL
jgi:RNA 2',3'-cyclic 3'-phosphodiesterase